MNVGQHTDECLRKAAEWDQKIREWDARWPDHCKLCDGHGAFTWTSTWEEPAGGEPCETCTCEGICARCGKPGLTSEDRGDESTGDGPCKHCGWDFDDGRPEPWDCWGCQPDDP